MLHGGTSGGTSILFMVLPYAHLCREARFADYAETSMFTDCFASLLLRAQRCADAGNSRILILSLVRLPIPPLSQSGASGSLVQRAL